MSKDATPQKQKRVSFAKKPSIKYFKTEENSTHSPTVISNQKMEMSMELTNDYSCIEGKEKNMWMKDENVHDRENNLNEENEKTDVNEVLDSQSKGEVLKFLDAEIGNLLEESNNKNLIDKQSLIKREEIENMNEQEMVDDLKCMSACNDTKDFNEHKTNVNNYKIECNDDNIINERIGNTNENLECNNVKILNDNLKDIESPESKNTANITERKECIDTSNVLMNTVDLRTMIPREDNNNFNINETLASIGIRFLDDLILKQTRRSTINKSKNAVKELYVYYKFYFEERIAFFSSFLSFIEEKMRENELLLKDREKEMRVEDFVGIKNAKGLKTECRNRIKIKWHEMRRAREVCFNTKISDCKNMLIIENKILREELRKREEEREAVTFEIKELENKLRRMQRNEEEIKGRRNDGDKLDKWGRNEKEIRQKKRWQ